MAEQSIDKLQVEIEASAKGTSAAFIQLEKQLTTLQKALDGLDITKINALNKATRAAKPKVDTSGMSTAERNIKASVDKIQQSLAGLTAYANKSLTGDKSAFSTYEKQATSLQSAIDGIKEKFRQLGDVSIPTKEFEKNNQQIEETKSHLESLKAKEREVWDSGGKNTTAYDVAQLGFAIQEAEDKLKSLEAEQDKLINEGKGFHNPFIPYIESIDNVQAALTNMSSQVHEAMSSVQTPSGPTVLDKLSEKINGELPGDISKLQTQLAGLGSVAQAAMGGDKSSFTSFERRVIAIQGEIDKLSEKIRQLENIGNMPTESLDAYKAAIGDVSARLTEMANNVRTAFSATGASQELDKTSNSADKASASLSKLFSKTSDSHKLRDAVKGIANSFSKMGDAANKGFMKILKYGFGIRSIYVLFRRLRKAVTESFAELQNSGAFFETTRANVEALKSSLSTLKFQFGAAFEPIFNAVAPALETLVNYLVTVMNVISAFTAKLMGKSTYSKVSATFGKVASGAGGAGKAVKELNKQLQGFDELNNLSEDKPSGGGGGGGGGAGSGGAEYIEASVDDVLGDFGKNLAEKIRAGDWEGVGQVISDKLSDAMENIDWNKIYQKAKDFGKGLAEFLNGLINPRLFGNLGKTLASALNTAFYFLKSFGEEFDWNDFGLSIATGVNNFFATFDFKAAGRAIHAWLSGALDMATTFFTETDFKEIGKKIAEFIGSLNIPDLVSKLWTLAKAILSALADAIESMWTNGDTTTRLLMAIVGILATISFVGKLNTLVSNIATALGTDLSGKTISVGKLLIAVGTYELVGKLTAATLSGEADILGYDELSDEYAQFADHPILYTFSGLADIASFIKEDGLGKFAKVIAEVFSPKSEFIQTLKGLFEKQENLFKDIFGDENTTKPLVKHSTGEVIKRSREVTGDYNGMPSELQKYANQPYEHGEVVDRLMQGFNGMPADIIDMMKDTEGYGTSIRVSKETSLYKGLSDEITKAGKATKELTSHSQKATSAINKETKQIKTFGNTGKQSASDIRKGYNGMPSDVAEIFNKTYVQATNEFSGSETWASKTKTKITQAFEGLSGDLQGKFKTAYVVSTNEWTGAGKWASDKSQWIQNGFTDLPIGIAGLFGQAYTDGTGKFNDGNSWASKTAQKIQDGFAGMPGDIIGKFGTAYTQGTAKFNGAQSWAVTVSGKIKEGISTIPGNFDKTFQNASNNAQTRLKVFKEWFDKQNYNKTAVLDTKLPETGPIQQRWNEISSIWNRKLEAEISVHTSASFSMQGVKDALNNIIDQFNSRMQGFAANAIAGGLRGVAIRNIPHLQAKGSVLDKPTNIIAGEAGAEAIVPLENNLGWLRKMSGMIVGEMTRPNMPSIAHSTYGNSGYSSANASDIAEQNRLLQEQNDLLRQIASKELTVSTREVFDATRTESNNYYNRTGNSPFLF